MERLICHKVEAQWMWEVETREIHSPGALEQPIEVVYVSSTGIMFEMRSLDACDRSCNHIQPRNILPQNIMQFLLNVDSSIPRLNVQPIARRVCPSSQY